MDRWLDKLWDYLAQDKPQTMRERIYRLMCLVVMFASFCVILPTNLFEPDMPIYVNLLVVGIGLFALFCFTESKRGRYRVKTFVVAIGLVMNLTWFLNGGMDGSLNFYFFAYVILPMVFFEGRLRWIFLAAILVDFSGLNLVGYLFPRLVTPFPSRQEQVIDIVTGSAAGYVSIVMLIWMVVKHYDQERKQLSASARELEASEEKFSKAFRFSPNGIAISELETGRFIDVNDGFCRLCGYTRAEVLGRTSLEMGVWESAAERERQLRSLLTHGSVHEVELRKPIRDGQFKTVLYSAEMMELGGKRCVVSLIQDISERKQTEEALRFANRRLGFIAQMSAAVLVNSTPGEMAERLARQTKEAFDVDACIIRALENNQLVLLGACGVPENQLAPSLPIFGLAEKLLTTRAPLNIPNVRQHPVTKDLPNPAPGGFAFESVAGVPLVAEGEIIGILSVYMAREPRVFTPVDVEHLQIVANHAAVSLSNERYFKTVRSQKNQLELAIAEREQTEAKRQRVEHALRESEERFRQSQKMEAIGQLAGGVAHDFNNILTALIMQTELMGMIDALPAEAREGLQQIQVDTKRAAELTRQLLLFSRRQVMQSRLLDLNEVVMNLAKMLQRIMREDVKLQLNLHPGPLLTRADAGMLDQVLMNLAVNARDAMTGGGQLRIDTAEVIVDEATASLYPDARPGRFACLRVSDTGGGIPPAVVPRIFEPFFTTKEAGKGTGLGLATVFGIVKQHEGWITLDNRPGDGATFQIFLPATVASATELLPASTRPKPRGGAETILMVEDEPAVLKMTRRFLERHGYTVLAANNGLEALQLWEQQHSAVALLFTDLVMPGGLNGQELARKLQAQRPDLKVIFASGYSAEIAGRDFQLRPGEAFLQKPCSTDRVLETIRQCLES